MIYLDKKSSELLVNHRKIFSSLGSGADLTEALLGSGDDVLAIGAVAQRPELGMPEREHPPVLRVVRVSRCVCATTDLSQNS